MFPTYVILYCEKVLIQYDKFKFESIFDFIKAELLSFSFLHNMYQIIGHREFCYPCLQKITHISVTFSIYIIRLQHQNLTV